MSTLTTREISAVNPAHEFMRWHAGVVELRTVEVPIYKEIKDEDGKIRRDVKVDHYIPSPTGETAAVFRLLGYGETEEAALRMAKSYEPNTRGDSHPTTS